MSIMMDIGEIAAVLESTGDNRYVAPLARLKAAAAELGLLMQDHSNELSPHSRVACGNLDLIDVWGGRLMIGFHPEDGDYSGPIPRALQGYDDEGWDELV